MAVLETRQLGRTGLTVTRFGAGGHFTNGPLSHEDIPRRVRELNHLLDLGVTYIDVQWEPEEFATAEVMRTRRDDFTVAWPLHGVNKLAPGEVKRYVLDYCDDHRKRFGIEHVDILLWVGLNVDDITGPGLIREVHQAFEDLKANGFCNHLAFSCHHSPQMAMKAITDHDVFDVMMVPYSPLHPAVGREVLAEARARRVGTVAMKPFGGGGGFFNKVWSGEIDHRHTTRWQGSSRPYEAAIRWVLADTNVDVAVPAAHSVQQIDELYAAVTNGEDPEDAAILAALKAAMDETGVEVQLRGKLPVTPDAWD